MKKDLENAFIKKYPNNDSIFYVTKNKNIDEETDKLFAYFKKNGFPHYDIQEYDKNKEFSLIKFILGNNKCRNDKLDTLIRIK